MQGIHALPPIPPSPATRLEKRCRRAMDIIFLGRIEIAFGCETSCFIVLLWLDYQPGVARRDTSI
jgi:hypothetical protein